MTVWEVHAIDKVAEVLNKMDNSNEMPEDQFS